MISIDATYSAEDNKLRLYASERLDEGLYRRVKEMGFKWAPKQELFVAPMWTPDREDFCIELAGEITAEQTTLVERAEAKAERLDHLAIKRAAESSGYHAAANRISERFAYGQPILVGHHSERKARKDQEKMHNAMDRAIRAQEAVSYWNYRATGVERHANRKADPGVRARRIKTLLTELRDRQRRLNHANLCTELWQMIERKKGSEKYTDLVLHYAGAQLKSGSAAPHTRDEGSLWSQLREEKINPDEVVNICLKFHDYQANNPYTFRWINHILNRLDFERSELGPVVRFTGTITPAVLQTFCRTHGADCPKAKKSEQGFSVSSVVPLPLHIAEGTEVDLSVDGWRDLMESVGYEVPAAKPKAPAILNFKCASIEAEMYGRVNTYPQIEMTKAEYSKIHADYRGVRLSRCGQFRFKTCLDHKNGGGLVSVFLNDSKVHEAPESEAVSYEEAAA